ncbi:hypothetical protein [Natronosalvus vescus]|uniref:hypothetical protein n=1 Tax=Natronosalvus vescus TaxID=2953881 RepID=UPI0020904F8E|nr:hypothetical protein [Natronosalvus vescus]
MVGWEYLIKPREEASGLDPEAVHIPYWYYITFVQLEVGTDAEYSPLLRFIGLFIPIVNLVILWWFAKDCEAVVDESGLLLFLAELVFPPILWYLVQTGINDVAANPV